MSMSNFVQIRGRIIKHQLRTVGAKDTKLVEMTLVASNGGKDSGPQYWDLTKWAPDQQFLKGLKRIEDNKVRVIVLGELRKNSWETQDGQKRSKGYILVDEVVPVLSQPREQRQRDDDGEEDERPRKRKAKKAAKKARRRPEPEPEPEIDVEELDDEEEYEEDEDDEDIPF